MLIRYFRKLQTLTPLLLLFVGALLWLEVYLDTEPVFYLHASYAGPLYDYLQAFLEQHQKISWGVAFLFLYLQAVLLNQIVTDQGILDKYSFLTSLIYVMLMSSFKGLLYMHPVLFANFFILIAVGKIFRTYDQEVVLVEVFNVGMLISIAGLFYFPAFLFFVLLLISLFIYYIIDLRSFIAACMGFLLPFFFLILVLFLTDKLQDQLYVGSFELSFSGLLTTESTGIAKGLMGYIGGMAALSVFHLVFVHLPDKPIRLRKRLWVLFYFFLTSLLTLFFVPVFYTFHLGLLFLPLSVVFAGFFHQIDKKVIAEILFTVLIGLIIAGKVYDYVFL